MVLDLTYNFYFKNLFFIFLYLESERQFLISLSDPIISTSHSTHNSNKVSHTFDVRRYT